MKIEGDAVSKTLPEVMEDIFAFHGAILDKADENLMEFLAPEGFARRIGIPEHGTLSFEYNITEEDAVYASYDSDLFKSVGKFLSEDDRFASARYTFNVTSAEKLARVVEEKTLFSNAVSRYETVERKTIGYLLVCFKYTALSDEKREGLVFLLINELNNSATPFDGSPEMLLNQLKESDRRTGERANISIDTLEHAHAPASEIVKERLTDFTKSLERRLNRDAKRIHEYYETLSREIEKAANKKGLATENTGGDETRKLLEKIEAIKMEQQWKIQDLISKYALNIKLEPVLIIRIMAEVPVFWIHIKRRLSSREFPFTYNTILKRFDDLPCEACFYPQGGYYVCDEKSHIVCAKCFKKCSQCGKQYCAACHKNGCPRCRTDKQDSVKDRNTRSPG